MTGTGTGPIGNFDHHRAYKAYFEGPARERKHVLQGLVPIIGSAVTLSVEAFWPTLRDLSRRAEEGAIELSNGWTIRSVKTSDPEDLAIALEHEDTPGGFLFNSRMRTEMTPEARARVSEFRAAKMAAAEAIEDPDVREAAVKGLKTARFTPVSEIEGDRNNFSVTENTSMVTCCVYRSDGLYPPGYSGTGETLEKTLDIGFSGERYQSAKLFEVRPSIYLQYDTEMKQKTLPMSSREPVYDPAMTVAALEVLAEAFSELDLIDGVKTRLDSLSGVEYEHFSLQASETLLIEMGMGSVLTTGFPWEQAQMLFTHYFTAAAAIDVENAAAGLQETVDKMRAEGYVSEANMVEWNDADYSVFVNAETDDGVDTLSIDTRNGCFRVDIKAHEDGGLPQEICASVVSKRDRPGPSPEPDQRGFLLGFERPDDESTYWPIDIGEFTTKNYRSMNILVSALETLRHVVAPKVEQSPSAIKPR